jgi:hypothetical protein
MTRLLTACHAVLVKMLMPRNRFRTVQPFDKPCTARLSLTFLP